MTHRWRTLPDKSPSWTMPVLYAVATSAAVGVAVGGVGCCTEFSRAAREAEFWFSFLICTTLPVLVVASWGLVFRRFAIGSAWMTATFAVATLASGCFAGLVMIAARGKDSIGAGIILLFGTPLLFLCVLIASGIGYATYWRQRTCRVSEDHSTTMTDRSRP